MNRYQINNSVAFSVDFSPAMSVNVSESRSIISIAMTGAGTLSLSSDSKPVPGDEIILKVSSDATARDLTFGTGFQAPILTGVINKIKTQLFVYDGTKFIPTGAAIQIN